jgi:hypothetical protein
MYSKIVLVQFQLQFLQDMLKKENIRDSFRDDAQKTNKI